METEDWLLAVTQKYEHVQKATQARARTCLQQPNLEQHSRFMNDVCLCASAKMVRMKKQVPGFNIQSHSSTDRDVNQKAMHGWANTIGGAN